MPNLYRINYYKPIDSDVAIVVHEPIHDDEDNPTAIIYEEAISNAYERGDYCDTSHK